MINSSINQLNSTLENKLSIHEAKILKFYKNLNKIECKLKNGEIITADINFTFVTEDMQINFVPDGMIEFDDNDNEIIKPQNDIFVNILSCIHNNDMKFYAIGYFDENYLNYSSDCKKGSIEFSAGKSRVEINKKYINIQTENLLINGVKVGRNMDLYVDKLIMNKENEDEDEIKENIIKDDDEEYIIHLPPEYQTEQYKNLQNAVKQLNNLVGLNKTKKQVSRLMHLLIFNEKYKKSGHTALPVSKNVVFTGNPGTGKTTVAAILGKIYKELGIISIGHFNKYDNSSLIGEYTGQTAPKIKKAFMESKGGVLFIDEAYNLCHNENDQYGKEALATIVGEMHDDGQDDIAVILAGYKKAIIRMMSFNEGMLDRFNTYIEFPDYNPTHLREIFEFNCRRYGIQVGAEAEEVLMNHINTIYHKREKGYANARTINKLFTLCSAALAERYFEKGLDPSKIKPFFDVEDINQGIINAKTEFRLENS